MTDFSPHEILREALQHLDATLAALDRIARTSEKTAYGDPLRLRKKLLRLCDNPDVPREKKIKRLARGLKTYSLLCRVDDLQNDLRCYRDVLDGLISDERVPPSDVPFWRAELYDNMATVFLLDRENNEENFPKFA